MVQFMGLCNTNGRGREGEGAFRVLTVELMINGLLGEFCVKSRNSGRLDEWRVRPVEYLVR
jgi:hypothetical protein